VWGGGGLLKQDGWCSICPPLHQHTTNTQPAHHQHTTDSQHQTSPQPTQLVAAATKHGVPVEPMEQIGGGVADWRRDRARLLHLSQPFVSHHSGGPNGQMTAADVLSLVGVLTKQSLPIHYKVTTEGGKTL